MAFTLGELASRIGGRAEGDPALRLERVAPLEGAGPADVSFYANKRYRKAFEESRAGAVIVADGEAVPAGRTVLRAPQAYLAFAKACRLFHPPREAVPEVAPEAWVHPSAQVHPSAEVLPHAYVGADAVVGARTILHPGVVIAAGAHVGDDCVLHANAVVREGCRVGHRCVLQPGAVLGADGFGFAFDMEGEDGSGPRHLKVPQAGIAVLEDDVELGANACVDRATMGRTVVGKGSKVDNLVQVGHNCEIGPLTLIAAQTGLAGSTKVGMGVVLGGQVGLSGHLTVGDGARLGAQAGVLGDVPAGETYTGYPAVPHFEWLRASAALRKLPDLLRQVRALERKVAELEGKR